MPKIRHFFHRFNTVRAPFFAVAGKGLDLLGETYLGVKEVVGEWVVCSVGRLWWCANFDPPCKQQKVEAKEGRGRACQAKGRDGLYHFFGHSTIHAQEFSRECFRSEDRRDSYPVKGVA